jgi:hypothetical protein
LEYLLDEDDDNDEEEIGLVPTIALAETEIRWTVGQFPFSKLEITHNGTVVATFTSNAVGRCSRLPYPERSGYGAHLWQGMTQESYTDTNIKLTW